VRLSPLELRLRHWCPPVDCVFFKPGTPDCVFSVSPGTPDWVFFSRPARRCGA
jgi:hypothetical protein